ncbi:DUF4153 domain-containing protein [Kiloniella laminariae]|uniref:DUF4153 domain-containing protein n=1 Tax=Kiloniella laminariae TaxID=454162 RepID=A0ABT4LJI1_9PROT|nr:DUF4153 domain-containing protein [Kiloniella laminariae]MCZ4280152.1 DUF4153 domain-containing protein [Kiloniella laminariae]
MSDTELPQASLWYRITFSCLGTCSATLLFLLANYGAGLISGSVTYASSYFLLLGTGLCFLCLERNSWKGDTIFCLSISMVAVALSLSGSFLWKDDAIPASYQMALVLSMMVLFAIPAVYYQTARQNGCAKSKEILFPRYKSLFENAWSNKLLLLFAGLFLGTAWAILGLCGELFELISIDFFSDLFTSEPFAYIFSGLTFGLGVSLARERPRIIQSLLQIVLTLFRFLAPLLGLVALLFILTLAVMGPEKLWATGHATQLLLTLLFLFILFENAVIQSGEDNQGFPGPVQWLIMAVNVTLPAFALLALYAVWLRVEQYGWTPERFYMAVLAVIGLIYAISYAVAVLTLWKNWTDRIIKANPVIALLVLVFAVLIHLPPFEPYRLSLKDQISRLEDGRIKPADFDFSYLRFRLGTAGQKALKDIENNPVLMADPLIASRIEQVKKQSYYQASADRDAPDYLSLGNFTDYLVLYPSTIEVPGDVNKALVENYQWVLSSCYQEQQPEARCLLVNLDLNQDSQKEFLLISQYNTAYSLMLQPDGSWKAGPQLTAGYNNGSSKEYQSALERGDFRLTAPTIQNLTIGDQLFQVEFPYILQE